MVVFVLVRWSETVRLLTEQLSFFTSDSTQLLMPIRSTFVTFVASLLLLTCRKRLLNAEAVKTKHRYVVKTPFAIFFIKLLWLVLFQYINSDFTDQHSVCLQAALPGTNVNEHCSSYHDHLNTFPVQCLLSLKLNNNLLFSPSHITFHYCTTTLLKYTTLIIM